MNALTTDEQRLKVATKALQKAAGGVEACAEITGLGKSQHGNYGNVNAPDFIPLNRIVELEQVTLGAGHPHVTRLLCQMAGGVFMPVPRFDGGHHEIPAQMMAVAKEFGEVSAQISSALADDGEIDPREAATILRELDEMDRASGQLRSLLIAIRDRDAG